MYASTRLLVLCFFGIAVCPLNGQELVKGSEGVQFWSARLSPDNSKIVASQNTETAEGLWQPSHLILFNRVSGDRRTLVSPADKLAGGNAIPTEATFSADGKYLHAGGSGVWTAWDVDKFQQVFSIRGQPAGEIGLLVQSFATPKRGPGIAVSVDVYESKGRLGKPPTLINKIYWHELAMDQKQEIAVTRAKEEQNDSIQTCMAVTESGRLLAHYNDKNETVFFVDVDADPVAREVAAIKWKNGRIQQMTFSQDEKTLWICNMAILNGELESSLYSFDVANKKLSAPWKLPKAVSWFHVWGVDSKILLFYREGKGKDVEVWNSATKRIVTKVDLGETISKLDVSPDGTLLVGCGARTGIYVWPLQRFLEQGPKKSGKP